MSLKSLGRLENQGRQSRLAEMRGSSVDAFISLERHSKPPYLAAPAAAGNLQ
jgi:hypothetical protein